MIGVNIVLTLLTLRRAIRRHRGDELFIGVFIIWGILLAIPTVIFVFLARLPNYFGNN